ncbi:MAG: hypothetical protein AAF497_15940, partial [Planctomycetota bacterium]
GKASLYYIFSSNGNDYFTMYTAAGTRLLIDLSTGVVDSTLVDAADMQEFDRREISSVLTTITETLVNTGAGFDDQKLYGALLSAARYDMKELIPKIEIVEEKGWHELIGWIPDYSYGVGMRPEIQSTTYRLNEDRRFAELALRRLGQSPRGFGQFEFDGAPNRPPIATSTKAGSIERLQIGQTSGHVFKQIGPPDYIMSAIEDALDKPPAYRDRRWTDSWRYDMGGRFNYTILILWTDHGTVDAIHRISPGLWNVDGVFETRSEILQADGSFNGIHLYGKHFIGTNDEFHIDQRIQSWTVFTVIIAFGLVISIFGMYRRLCLRTGRRDATRNVK